MGKAGIATRLVFTLMLFFVLPENAGYVHNHMVKIKKLPFSFQVCISIPQHLYFIHLIASD